jgi:hypothetical protein
MTDETIKELRAHLFAHDVQLKAQSEEIRTLRAENKELRAGKAKQEEMKNMVQARVDELEAKHDDQIALASNEIVLLTDTISSHKTNSPTSSPSTPKPTQTPSTDVPTPTVTTPNHTLNPAPSTSPHSTSLALPWRCVFLLVGSATPIFDIIYAIKGDRYHAVMGGAVFSTSFGSMALYYFGSLDRHDHEDITNEGGQQRPLSRFKSFLAFINRSENRSLAVVGLWATTIQLSYAIGHLYTNPDGNSDNTMVGGLSLSMIFWLNPPLLYFVGRFRNVLSLMSPSEISSYLSTNILTIGISSITPMMYLSMDTIKCTSRTDHTQNVYNQCSGVLVPQQSICFFLLIMMAVKVVIAPLSITTLTANDLIKLNLPHRLIFEGALFGLSFLLNLCTSLQIWKRGKSLIASQLLERQPISSPSYPYS